MLISRIWYMPGKFKKKCAKIMKVNCLNLIFYIVFLILEVYRTTQETFFFLEIWNFFAVGFFSHFQFALDFLSSFTLEIQFIC